MPCAHLEALIDAQRVLVANRAASERGIRAGMAVSAAYALAPQLTPRPRDARREAEGLIAAAMWASQFTPSVSFEADAPVMAELDTALAPQAAPTTKVTRRSASRPRTKTAARADAPAAVTGLLLDIAASLKLFGGHEAILARLRDGIVALGFSPVIASAPTARAAWWLARAGEEIDVEPAALVERVQSLPLAATDCGDAALTMFESIGVRRIGEALALPREGFARRFGQPLLDALDRALDRAPEPRRYFVPPDRFHARLELPAAVEHAEALLFAARRLVVQLCGYLAARASGVPEFALTLTHDDDPPTVLRIGLVSPGRDESHFALLLRERLGATRLRAPVYEIALDAGTIVPQPGMALGLFDDPREASGEWAKLVERLRARLGERAVHGVAIAAEHRPEYVSRPVEPGRASEVPAFGPRPLWLLRTPQRLLEVGEAPHHKGPLVLLAGPERIESGWWDGGDSARDYFIAQDVDQALLWVFRERQTLAGWFLHGLFA